MEGYCSTGLSPQRAVVPVEEEQQLLKRFGISPVTFARATLEPPHNCCGPLPYESFRSVMYMARVISGISNEQACKFEKL
jgi:hypothetical protein